jgi:hypothetical protein
MRLPLYTATTAYDISIIVDYKTWFMPWTRAAALRLCIKLDAHHAGEAE